MVSTETIEEVRDFTPCYVAGFAERLEAVCEFAGIKKHGCLSALARMSNMTAGGIRLLFTHDRPPKYLSKFDLIVDGLLDEVESVQRVQINRPQLVEYLLNDSVSPLAEYEVQDKTSSNNMLSEFDAVDLGLMYVFIDEVAKENGVNIFKQLPRGMVKKLISRVMSFYTEKRADLDSPDFRDIVRSAVLLAKEGML